MARTALFSPSCSRIHLVKVMFLILMAEFVLSDTGQLVGRRLRSHRSWYPWSVSEQTQASMQQQQEQGRQESSNNTGPSCRGMLIGIGTQKGGTTAAWAYIKHNAHPMLQVSLEKEVGFWDQLHGWYKGCTLGDYMMLLNGSVNDFSDDSLPLCPAPGATGPMWAQHSNRLKSSKICGIKQQLETAAAVAAGLPVPVSSSISSRPCSAVSTPTKPWWWFWGGWHASTAATPAMFGQDGSPSNTTSSNSSANTVEAPEVSLRPMFHVDITPSYLYDSTAPLWVRSMLPEARILVILREPVSRAFSNFNMKWQKLREAEVRRNDTTFVNLSQQQREQAWLATLQANATRQMQELSACYDKIGTSPLQQPELAACMGVKQPYSPTYQSAMWEDAMLWQGIYADALERWFKLFPANQFLIWISEEFKAEPAAHMRQLISWLGLDPKDMNPKLLPGAKRLNPIHVREYEADAPVDLMMSMQQFYAPHNERLFALLENKGFGSVAARMRQAWKAAAAPAVMATAGAA